MVRKTPLLICILFLCAATALNAHRFEPGGRADSSSESPGQHISKPASDPIADIEARAGQAKSTSETPPPTRPFSSIATPVRDYPRVASSGVCAPHYKNGTRGRCIANKPCRGYGIRNDKNEALCMCYLTHGGCDAKSRCDDRAHACVADSIQKNKEE